MDAREQLKVLYDEKNGADGPGQKPTERKDSPQLRQQRDRIIARLRENYAKLKTEWGGIGSYDKWFAKPLNNAQLNTVAAYYDLVPGFRALLQKNGGDLEKFFQEVRALAKLTKPERHQRLLADAQTVAMQARFITPE
jgi:predicted aminopeptidase